MRVEYSQTSISAAQDESYIDLRREDIRWLLKVSVSANLPGYQDFCMISLAEKRGIWRD